MTIGLPDQHPRGIQVTARHDVLGVFPLLRRMEDQPRQLVTLLTEPARDLPPDPIVRKQAYAHRGLRLV